MDHITLCRNMAGIMLAQTFDHTISSVVWALALCALAAAAVGAEAGGGKFIDLGVQITSTTIQGTTWTKDRAGNPLVCTVIRGQPAKLLVFDVASGKLLQRVPLEGANGGWN